MNEIMLNYQVLIKKIEIRLYKTLKKLGSSVILCLARK